MSTNQHKAIQKGIVDIALFLGLIGCFVSTSVFEESKEALRNGADIENVFNWGAIHCIVSLILIGVVFIHAIQHWTFIKALVVKKMYRKNLITTFTVLLFLITSASILLYLTGFTFTTLHFHSIVAHLFVFAVIIHFIAKFKKLIHLFKRNKYGNI